MEETAKALMKTLAQHLHHQRVISTAEGCLGRYLKRSIQFVIASAICIPRSKRKVEGMTIAVMATLLSKGRF